MCRVVLLNTTAINISQLSYLSINHRASHGKIGIHAHLITHQILFLQETDDAKDALIKLKEFTQKCNGTYRAPTPTPPGPE